MSQAAAMPEGAAGRAVLIVDDDACFAESLADILASRGYRVHVADSAAAALHLLRDGGDHDEGAVAVALVDVRLGVTSSGVDLLSQLKNTRPDLVCVTMTADLDTQTAIAALRRGAYDYFDKSCDPGALLAVLDRCFERVQLQRERQAAYDALRAAKEEAEAANQAKSGFLATMSHELRTPLNAIIGFSEMMMREVMGPIGNEHYSSYIADIFASGTHLLEIINDILDLSKAEAGKLELCEDVFDVREAIRAVVAATGARAQEGGLTTIVQLPEDLPPLRADERKTRQVLFNLIGNALKFTPSGGIIEIFAACDAETGLSIAVCDNGIGIAPEDLGRVLQPFEQVDNTLSRRHQGTGLGLPLVKAIMELHGGTLTLASTPGAGTRATVTFPRERVVLMREPDAA